MGFYIRKSFKAGPVRFNLSKSGVGVSAGVKGLRAGVDSKGRKYTHAGRGGIYHKQYHGNICDHSSEPIQATLVDEPSPEELSDEEFFEALDRFGWVIALLCTIVAVPIALLVLFAVNW